MKQTHSRKTRVTIINTGKYRQNELETLGIEPQRQNDLNDKEEVEALAEIVKSISETKNS